MNWKAVIGKVVAGEPLDVAERDALSRLDADAVPEVELAGLREQARTAETERDAARRELGELRFTQQVRELAGRSGFTDPDYLGYLLGRKGLSPEAGAETEAFIAELKGQCPKLFRLELKSGAGTLPPLAAAMPAAGFGSPADELTRLLESAPEIGSLS